MNTKHWHSPVLLLVDDERTLEWNSIRTWLSGRNMVFYEASDVFDALDELCDFTVGSSPDLILIPVNSRDLGADDAERMLGTIAPEAESNVVVFSKNSRSKGAVHDLDELGASLSQCFTYPSRAARTTASA